MTNPYVRLPKSGFWRSGVADLHPSEYEDIYCPKSGLLPTDKVAVAGSCFAQHVAKAMKANNIPVLDVEPAPPQVSVELAKDYGYGLYSARYGNIYTSRQLLQLVLDCQTETVRDNDIWIKDGRAYDALRPSIEPGGYSSPDEARTLRRQHLAAVRSLFSQATLLVFTLGLTECWADRKTGIVYPTCPGVIAGEFDPARYVFLNLSYADVIADMQAVRKELLAMNPAMRLLLTVSPVPLTATASGDHVLPATIYSKSVLRAVCGALSSDHEDIDYFPSYELIASHPARGFYFEPNMRSVSKAGVDMVMRTFLKAHGYGDGAAGEAAALRKPKRDANTSQTSQDDVICDEVLLEAFNRT